MNAPAPCGRPRFWRDPGCGFPPSRLSYRNQLVSERSGRLRQVLVPPPVRRSRRVEVSWTRALPGECQLL